MREKSNLGPILIILVCAIAAGLLVGWLAVRNSDSASSAQTVAETEAETNARLTNAVATEETMEAAPEPAELPLETTAQETDEVTAENWNDKLSDVLASDKIDEDQKADKLADMILVPKLPESAQVEIAEHFINLVSDENYRQKAAVILTRETTPGSVSGVLFHDLMNRSDALGLPLTLQIARNKDHPLHAEAVETLEMRLVPEEDPGEDWDKWEKLVEENLKEQGLWEEATSTNSVNQTSQ